MALTIYNIRKWFLMLTGRSVLHVNQDLGKCFAANEVKGYYNNLTEKVTMLPELLENDELPQLDTSDGQRVYFPVAIFQYGLGAYDLYLMKDDDVYRKKFLQALDWTAAHQEKSGAWNNFFYVYPNNPYGAMAQGEGASLLIRGYVMTGRNEYLEKAKAAIDFMLLPIEEGGTTKYENQDVVLLEYTHMAAVMNGWIFALFGLHDMMTIAPDDGHYSMLMKRSVDSLEKMLPLFDRGFWSMYDLEGRIASPFYHRLHIAQMQALYALTKRPVFQEYAAKWQKNDKQIINHSRAFIIKAWQK